MSTLNRYLNAQKENGLYESTLNKIKNNRYNDCYSPCIFPPLRIDHNGPYNWYYGIETLDEAKRFLEIDVLKERLYEISEAVYELHSNPDNKDIIHRMCGRDEQNFKSCMTVFYIATGKDDNGIFYKILDCYFNGEVDENTVVGLTSIVES